MSRHKCIAIILTGLLLMTGCASSAPPEPQETTRAEPLASEAGRDASEAPTNPPAASDTTASDTTAGTDSGSQDPLESLTDEVVSRLYARYATSPAAPCSDATATEQRVIQGLTEAGLPLRQITPGGGTDDLEPLRAALEGVRLLGVGEATHGSREFVSLRHRLLEYLVREMDATLLAVEVGYEYTPAINRYLLDGEGDPARILSDARHLAFSTQSMLEVMRWLRAYNETAPRERRVRLVGIDLQPGWGPVDWLETYLERAAPEALPEAKPHLFRAAQRPALGAVPEAKALETMQALRDLHAYLEENRTALADVTSAAEAEQAIFYARNLLFSYHIYAVSRTADELVYRRDSYMSLLLHEAVADQPSDTLTVLWAHNVHLLPLRPGMGFHLRQAFGEQYYVLGQLFGQGSLIAKEGLESERIRTFTLGPPRRGQVEWYLGCGGQQARFIDLRRAPEPLRAWAEQPRLHWAAGAVLVPENPAYFLNPFPLGLYDGILYIPTVTPTRPLPPLAVEG